MVFKLSLFAPALSNYSLICVWCDLKPFVLGET